MNEVRSGQTKYDEYRKIDQAYGVSAAPAELLDVLTANFPEGEFSLVELGCGAGHVSGQINHIFPGASVVATDLMEACLQTARQNYPDLAVKPAVADEALPFADNSINIIVSLNLLEHVHDEQTHLQEVHRVLKPSGLYFVTTPHIVFDTIYWGLFGKGGLRRMHARVLARIRHDLSTAHCNLKTRRSLQESFERCGFSVQFLKRGLMPSTEREKLRGIFRFLPKGANTRVVGCLERVWLGMPGFVQPTIVAVGRKL